MYQPLTTANTYFNKWRRQSGCGSVKDMTREKAGVNVRT